MYRNTILPLLALLLMICPALCSMGGSTLPVPRLQCNSNLTLILNFDPADNATTPDGLHIVTHSGPPLHLVITDSQCLIGQAPFTLSLHEPESGSDRLLETVTGYAVDVPAPLLDGSPSGEYSLCVRGAFDDNGSAEILQGCTESFMLTDGASPSLADRFNAFLHLHTVTVALISLGLVIVAISVVAVASCLLLIAAIALVVVRPRSTDKVARPTQWAMHPRGVGSPV